MQTTAQQIQIGSVWRRSSWKRRPDEAAYRIEVIGARWLDSIEYNYLPPRPQFRGQDKVSGKSPWDYFFKMFDPEVGGDGN